MTTFQINDELVVKCTTHNTRTGFKHIATLYHKDGEKVTSASQNWCNRTWESWTFEEVMKKLARRLQKHFSDAYAQAVQHFIANYKQPNPFKGVAAIAAMSALFGSDLKEQNDLTKRIVATVPGLDIPADFDDLPEDERKRRLDKVLQVMKED